MKVKKHISFRNDSDLVLIQYLNGQEIAYNKGGIISSLDIYEHNVHWPYIQQYVHNNDLVCYSETSFSKKELSDAAWLTMRSKWRNGYPQPEDAFGYERITYEKEKHCVECGAGLRQKESFQIKKTPNWGQRHFMMLNWVEDELFVDDSAKTVLDTSRLSGIEFAKVKNKQGLEFLPNVNQLVVKNILPAGLQVDCRAINATHFCPKCGIPKYHPSGEGMYEFNRAVFENAPDIVKTNEWFGWGYAASRLIIVSQKTYQLITQNNLDRGLVFEPVLLV